MTAHPPKREVFDVAAGVNIDNKGFVRTVEAYEVTPYGLYMNRTADHPRFERLESWLIPELGLRANIFHYLDGYRAGQRLYLDIGEFSGPDEDGRWHAVDWYLDLVDHPGSPLRLIDVDDLLEAVGADELSAADAETAVGIATRALVGAAECGHDVQRWLERECGGPVFWLDRPRAPAVP
ncbi:DUF402 domain-containing protein [Gordonia soli]|uniref:DUF402 domain-containing protein n=1 Tax=Gordonia soli NBRC 108243 TaxID=1223545 RepID=M0QMW9_9ACTN|nr:DUF402 domain-containing protein [Gordonia soli]GAC69903.1 hypothetical protein GS4_29_00020 [Gordonia soli NBRC 108243]